MLQFLTNLQNGGDADDFLFGGSVGLNGDPDHVLNGGKGDDLLIGDVGQFISSTSNIFSLAQLSSIPGLYNTFGSPDIGAEAGVPSTLIYSEANGGFEYYSFSLDAGQTITLDLDYGAHAIGQSFDPVLSLFNFNDENTVLASNNDSAIDQGAGGSTSGFDSLLTFTPSEAGLYVLEVGRFMASGPAELNTGDTYLLNVSIEGLDFDDTTIFFGDDSLDGGEGDDVLYGRRGADTLIGGAGDDLLDGGADADMLDAGTGVNIVNGGDGDDTLAFTGAAASYDVTEDGDALIISDADETTTARNVETFMFNGQAATVAEVMAMNEPSEPPVTPTPTPPITPSPSPSPTPTGPTEGNDTLTGTEGADVIDALGGDDLVSGLGGDDILSGSAGNDTLLGQGGDDRLIGSTGADELVGDIGNDTLLSGGGRDRAVGNAGSDSIKGGGGGDTLRGGGASDTIEGGGGRDRIVGGGGADSLDGGGGADLIRGGGGADLIEGGRFGDTLTGNGGRDIFHFDQGDGRDTITDFRQIQDRISIGVGADEFADLTITQTGDNVLIAFSNVRITVLTDDADAFGEADFIFG